MRNVNIGLDSLQYQGKDVHAVIRQLKMEERSGLSISSLTGSVTSNDTVISIPNLKLLTPHSQLDLTGQAYWKFITNPESGRLSARFDAYIGREDVMLFVGGLPEAFRKAYPFRPIVTHVVTEGNLKELQISRLSVDLPGALSAKGKGVLENLTDSLGRSGNVDINMTTQNLNFLAALTGLPPGGSFVIPDNMNLKANLALKGPQYKAKLDLIEGKGSISATAALNTVTEVYQADLKVEDLQLHHFLPKDSIYELSMSATASGKGFDVTSYRSNARLKTTVDQLHYAAYHISNINLDATLKRALITANLNSDNELLKMRADGEYNIARSYPEGKATIDVDYLNFYELGLMPNPVQHPVVFKLTGELERNRVFAHLTSGDMKLNLSARTGILPLISQSTHFVDVLMKQISKKLLDHSELRKALPTAVISFTAGEHNILSYYLATQNISFSSMSVKFGAAPNWGINGKAAIFNLNADTLLLDTVFFTVKQDTAQMNLRAGVINGPKNPQFTFAAIATGEIRDKDAELLLNFENAKGETGLLLGVRAQPLLLLC